ncbi:hypothetical protein ALC62_08866, partial [Cyphomyrmex costatus]
QLILSLSYVIILYIYLFVSNYTAQEITDHNEYVFTTVYNVQWYVAPLHIQKMILFLLQRGTKTFHMILGGIFVASLESAAAVRNTRIYRVSIKSRTGLISFEKINISKIAETRQTSFQKIYLLRGVATPQPQGGAGGARGE